MNKKIAWVIILVILALTCVFAAGCGHQHSYTEWGHNDTQHWKLCPDDDVIDESSKANHNFVNGSCECGATEKKPPVTDLTITNGTTDTNGTVTLSKTTAKTGDSVTVTVAPSDGYQLKSLTVNGANVFGAMTGNTYEFTISENTTVIAVFEKIASSSVNAVITGKKYGVTGNSLTAGTDVTLSAAGREDVTAKIEADGDNLVIKVDEIAGDNWTVKVDGYVAATIIIPRDAEYTSAIALEYDLFENLKATWGNADSVDLSKQNEGKIKHTGGYVQWVSTKNSFDSVAITATVGKGGFRQGVFIRFKGDSYDKDKYVMVSKENSDKIGWCAMDGGTDYQGGPISPWEDNIKPLTKDEYELTLVRDGADIYFFVDGEYINKKTFSDYADKECYVGLFCTDATAMENSERTFEIAQASAFLEVNVTNATAADVHGTVTIDKPTAKLNEQVTVTLAPETGYKIKDLRVDGESVLSQITGNSYTFTVLKNTTVVAEFEEITEVTVTDVKVSITDGTAAIDLGETVAAKLTPTVGDAYEITLTKGENGAYTFGGTFILGEYKLSLVDKNVGYTSPTVSITISTIDPITLTIGDIATATKYHSGDYHGMGECDFETLIDIDNETVKINTANANGKKVDAFWCWNSEVPEAVLNISDEVKNASNVTLEFNLKAANSNESPNNAFGIVMAAGYKGVNMSIWSANEKLAYYALTGNVLGNNDYGADKNIHDAWLKTAMYGTNGVNIRVVREGEKITFYAQNGEGWTQIFETTCDANAKTDIKFLGMGSDYTISNIAVMTEVQAMNDYEVTTSFTDAAAHGYAINVEKSYDFANGKVYAAVTVQTSDANAAWSYFPNAAKVNGTAIDFSKVEKVSLGANRCKYTFTIELTSETSVEVTVGKGTQVAYNASVNDDTMGSIKCDMEAYGKEYYWNDLCTFTVTATEGYELESLVIGEGDSATTITEGWTQNGNVYTYNYLVTGDIKVVANLKQTPVVTLNNVTVTITNGTDKVDLGESVNATLDGDTDYSVTLTKGADGTYTFGGTFLRGNYKLIVLGQNVGYSPVDVVIDNDMAAVSVQYVLATATKYHSGDYHGMGECDFETLIDIDNETIKINTANANGKKVDAFWCWNSQVPEAVLNISDEVKNASNVTLEFNLKAANSNESPNNAFGIVMAEGYKGVNMSVWSANEKLAYYALTGNVLGNNDYGADKNIHDAWLKTAMYGETGVNIRVVREGSKITFCAQNTALAEGEQWVKIFETTCDENAKTDIKFLGMGSDYTVSAISVTLNTTSGEQA